MMMVSIEQFKNGIARYADREIVQKLPIGTLKRVLIGSAVAIAMQNSVEPILRGEIVTALKICDGEGNVDVELLRDTLKNQMPVDGVSVSVPGVGMTMTFKPSDIDTVYQDIEEASML